VKRSDIPEPAPTAPGGTVPPSIAKALPTLIKMLSYAIEREATYPRRPELHRRLEAIEKSARLLIREMLDLRILALLLDGDERIENENEMYHGLRDIADRAARVRASNPPTQGLGKLYPEGATGPSPMVLCALIVAMAYHQGNGRWPGKNSARAHQLCEALWKAAEGPPRRGRGEPREPPASKHGQNSKAEINWGKSGSATVVVWRKHLKVARKYRPPHHAGILVQSIFVPNVRRKPASRHGELGKLLYDHQNSHPKERVRKKTE
jgi:hypothetical protein